MIRYFASNERRREPRTDSERTIRWKRPGRIEDVKGWMVDESTSGLGFMVGTPSAPRVGDLLHIRRRDGQEWASVERPVRVARITLMPGENLAMVGCSVE